MQNGPKAILDPKVLFNLCGLVGQWQPPAVILSRVVAVSVKLNTLQGESLMHFIGSCSSTSDFRFFFFLILTFDPMAGAVP